MDTPSAVAALTVICAWCPDVARTAPARASHGICPACAAQVEADGCL